MANLNISFKEIKHIKIKEDRIKNEKKFYQEINLIGIDYIRSSNKNDEKVVYFPYSENSTISTEQIDKMFHLIKESVSSFSIKI